MKIKRKAIVLLMAGLFSQNSFAVTEFYSDGHLSLEVAGFSDSNGNQFDIDSQPSDISILGFDNSADDNTYISSVGDAYSEAVSTPFSDLSLIELDVQTSGYSGISYAFANAEAIASGGFNFNNNSLTESYSVDMILSYSYSAIVETDTPLAQQNGFSGIDIDLFGDFNLNEILALSVLTDIEQGLFEGEEIDIRFSFLLEADGFETVFASISSFGESESLAPAAVPSPASIFLMAPALVGLSMRRKRKSV